MLGHSRMLDPKMRGLNRTREMGRRLLFKACYRLRRKQLFAKNLVVKFTFLGGQKWVGYRDFPASQDPFTMMQLFNELWSQMCLECFGTATPNFPDRKMIFLKVSTLLNGLIPQEEITNDLFETYIQSQNDKHEKQTRLASALDTLQNKYKKETVWLGVVPKTLTGNVGTKIAFNRVPEKEEFWN